MPTIHREKGFRVYIRLNEHPPPHVHVDNAGKTVLIYLGDEDTAPSLHEPIWMGKLEARYALRIVERHQETFIAAWERLHGS